MHRRPARMKVDNAPMTASQRELPDKIKFRIQFKSYFRSIIATIYMYE